MGDDHGQGEVVMPTSRLLLLYRTHLVSELLHDLVSLMSDMRKHHQAGLLPISGSLLA